MLERRLNELNGDLAYRYTCYMSLFELTLNRFLTTFPIFTVHALLHTLSVTNQLLREDEMDIASDRNPDLLYQTESMDGLSEKDAFDLSRHNALRSLVFKEQAIFVYADTETGEIAQGVIDCIRIVKETLSCCISVLEKRRTLQIQCSQIGLVINGNAVTVMIIADRITQEPV